jgi:hypothetical protein
MKAQFAITESMISIVIIAASVFMASSLLYSSSLMQNNAFPEFFFDLFQAAYSNSTVKSCLLYASNACDGILPEAASLYRLHYIGVESGKNDTSYGSEYGCKQNAFMCAPLNYTTGYTVSCVYVCG